MNCGTSIGARLGQTIGIARTVSPLLLPSTGASGWAVKVARQVADGTSPEPAEQPLSQIYEGRELYEAHPAVHRGTVRGSLLPRRRTERANGQLLLPALPRPSLFVAGKISAR